MFNSGPLSFGYSWLSLSPFLHLLQGILTRDKADAESLDQLMKQRNLPEYQQDAFKTGFTEGFMKSQALMQKTQGMFETLIYIEYLCSFA